MATSRRQASTTTTTVSRNINDKPYEFTPAIWCSCYSCATFFFFIAFLFISAENISNGGCNLELFAHSVSISNANANANVSTADWSIGVVARSPVTGCKFSLHAIKSRLLRGDEVVSESSPSVDSFGQLLTSEKTDEPVITVDFKTVVTPGVIGGVVGDYRVEIAAGLKIGTSHASHGFLMVLCGDLPVKFTADKAGNVVGSLLGNMKRCDYLLQDQLHILFRS